MSLHKDKVDDDIHALTAITYADITARDADTAFHVTTNLNKEVRVNDADGLGNIGYFKLATTAPTWADAGGAPATPTLAQVLSTGNATGGNDIDVATGDAITIVDAPTSNTEGTNKVYVDSYPTVTFISTTATVTKNNIQIAADTRSGAFTITIDESVVDSFFVFDAYKNFDTSTCTIAIDVDTYDLDKKDKGYIFAKDGSTWKHWELAVKEKS